MSQFSESFHFLGTPGDLVRRSKAWSLTPVIVAANDRWTTFVSLERGLCQADLAGTTGLVVHWTYAEDHAWSAALYSDGHAVLEYEQGWDPEPAPGTRTGSLEQGARLLGLDSDSLSRLLPVEAAGYEEGTAHAFGFAAELRLPVYEWVSPTLADRVTGCGRCDVVSHFSSSSWRCPGCGSTDPAGFPPEPPERSPASPGPSVDLAKHLRSALRRAMSSGVIALAPHADVERLVDEMIPVLEQAIDAPRREAVFAEWLIEHPDVEDLFVDDADLWQHLLGRPHGE